MEEESRILGVGLGTVRKNPECPGDLIDTCAMHNVQCKQRTLLTNYWGMFAANPFRLRGEQQIDK